MNDIVKKEKADIIHDGEFIEIDNKLEEDFDHARENLLVTIEKSTTAVDQMMSIAYQSQHPAAYEVLNKMMKTLGDLNKNLVDLQQRKKNINDKTSSVGRETKNITNNNTFVGTNADFLKSIEKKSNDKQ